MKKRYRKNKETNNQLLKKKERKDIYIILRIMKIILIRK